MVKKKRWQSRLKEWKLIHEAFKRKLACDREKAIIERWNNNRTRLLNGVEELLGKADLMMEHPLVEKIVKRKVIAEFAGQQIDQQITLAPSKWQMRDIAAFYKVAMDLMIDVVGDRERAIDKLHADGYLIVDPNSGDDSAFEKHLAALKTLEEIGI